MERWYYKINNKNDKFVIDDIDYGKISIPRNDYVHGRNFCLENDHTDIDKTIAVWKAFLEMLIIKP